MAKLPTYEEMAHEVAQRALDECEYEGKTLREWIEIIKTQHGTNLAEVGTDCISRQAAIDALHMDTSIIPFKKAREYADATISEIRNRLEKLPSAQPKMGRWIHDGSKWTNRWICSECGYKWFFDCIEGAYCPHCGAKMEVTE